MSKYRGFKSKSRIDCDAILKRILKCIETLPQEHSNLTSGGMMYVYNMQYLLYEILANEDISSLEFMNVLHGSYMAIKHLRHCKNMNSLVNSDTKEKIESTLNRLSDLEFCILLRHYFLSPFLSDRDLNYLLNNLEIEKRAINYDESKFDLSKIDEISGVCAFDISSDICNSFEIKSIDQLRDVSRECGLSASLPHTAYGKLIEEYLKIRDNEE